MAKSAARKATTETQPQVPPNVAVHGAATLTGVTVDAFNAQLRDDDGLVGDRARRDMLVEMEPDVFHLTDRYRAYSYVLIRIGGVDRAWLEPELKARWRKVAPAALRKAHPEMAGG